MKPHKKNKVNEINGSTFLENLRPNFVINDENDLKGTNYSIKFTSGKYYLVTFGISLLLLVYLILFYIQFFSDYHFKGEGVNIRNEALKRIERTIKIQQPRGRILDSNGKVLALSVPLQTFQLDVKVFTESKEGIYLDKQHPKFLALAQALNIDSAELYEKIKANEKSRYLLLKRLVTPTVAEFLRKLDIPGLTYTTEYRRFYPYGEATAQLLGLVDSQGSGQFGIEKLANNSLQPVDQTITYEHNFRREIIRYKSVNQSVPANDVKLTIDIDMQNIAYQALIDSLSINKADAASAILVDLQTSRILAMANVKSFNPNNRSTITGELTRNLSISNVFEPGSTVKPFVVYAGLKNKVIGVDTLINTASAKYGKREYRDGHARSAVKTPTEILKYSSNVGVINISQKLPKDELRQVFQSVGFGQPTGLGLSGESRGVFPRSPLSEQDAAAFSFGYQQLTSPLQLAHAYTTLGTYGIYRPLSIIYDSYVPPGEQVMDQVAAKQVLEMMISVTQRGGTATRAAVPNYNISAKTGTAKKTETQTFVNKEGKEVKKTVYVDKYIAYTAGIAPTSNPRFALVVVVDNAKGPRQGGGLIASPVFKSIMQSALSFYNVPEDNSSNQIIIQNK